jgi:acetyltransferase-like isoleucine patch superfamily enzyme
LSALWKNFRQSIRIAWNRLMVMARDDVILEPGAVIKFWKSVRFGRRCTVQASAYIYGSRAGREVSFGDYVLVSHGCMLLGEGGLTVGDFTHLGPGVVVSTQFGDSDTDAFVPDPVVRYSPVTIGRGCWIGIGAVVMPGAQLGDRCIVAPNSVVFGRWPDGATLSGNPARRQRVGAARASVSSP